MSRLWPRLLLGLILLAPTAAPGQEGIPVLELRIARAQPCAGLQWVDGLDRLRIDRLEMRAAGPAFEAELAGAIRCRGTERAVLRASAATDFVARIRLRLATCAPLSAETALANTAAATPVLPAFAARVETVIGAQLADWAGAACQALR